METSYVMKVDGTYRITGSRVSLDSVVYDFLSGLSSEFLPLAAAASIYKYGSPTIEK